ncbi:MAG: hypothetical protein H7839_10290 [Magnetococcus sp. YQC-5]
MPPQTSVRVCAGRSENSKLNILFPRVVEYLVEWPDTPMESIKAILDPDIPVGSSREIDFTTSSAIRWKTNPRRCPVNWVICAGDWEAEFCRVAEIHPRVLSYVKNQHLGFEVPYFMGSTQKKYLPDFIVLVNDGLGDALHLVVDILGFGGEDIEEKARAMRHYWVPGVNRLEQLGRWAFAEFTTLYKMEAEFDKLMASLTWDAYGFVERFAGALPNVRYGKTQCG